MASTDPAEGPISGPDHQGHGHDHQGHGHEHQGHGPDHQGHGHDHGTGVLVRAGSRHKWRLQVAVGALAALAVGQGIAAYLTNSLALLSDTGHVLTDVLGLAMALAAVTLADRPQQQRHRTFGLYRLEILAALANSVLLFGVAGWVLYEAVMRIDDPPEVLAGGMLVVAAVGLGVNVGIFLMLRRAAGESLNLKGAYLEVLADMLGSVAVIVAAAVIAVTGWEQADAIAGIGIGLFILPRTWQLGAQAVRILVQAAPPGTDLDALTTDLEALDGVVDVHDLHVWTLTSEMEVATAHVMVRDGTDAHGVLDQARVLLTERYGIDHATLQVEPDTHTGCDEVEW
jgi:cobalt-zinc-cadmium efflux system protein